VAFQQQLARGCPAHFSSAFSSRGNRSAPSGPVSATLHHGRWLSSRASDACWTNNMRGEAAPQERICCPQLSQFWAGRSWHPNGKRRRSGLRFRGEARSGVSGTGEGRPEPSGRLRERGMMSGLASATAAGRAATPTATPPSQSAAGCSGGRLLFAAPQFGSASAATDHCFEPLGARLKQAGAGTAGKAWLSSGRSAGGYGQHQMRATGSRPWEPPRKRFAPRSSSRRQASIKLQGLKGKPDHCPGEQSCPGTAPSSSDRPTSIERNKAELVEAGSSASLSPPWARLRHTAGAPG